MAVYKFRVTFEDFDDVSRDIEIKPSQTFKDLRLAIQQAIKFDDSKPSSFFMSNDHWTREREISSEPKKNKDGSEVALMEKSVLNKFIIDPHQKIYYVFDTWSFFVELIKIVLTPDLKASYPRCTRVNGEGPLQYKKIILPAAGETEEPEEFTLPEEEPAEDDTIVPSAESFDDDHGFESEEGEEPEMEEGASEEQFGEE